MPGHCSFQVGMHGGVRWSAFAEPELRSMLAYIARRIREIFDNRELPAAEFAPPAARDFFVARGNSPEADGTPNG